MRIRYADGRAAITHEGACALGADALSFEAAGARHQWAYADLARADDNNGALALKRRSDTGERLYFEPEAEAPLRLAAPQLFAKRARGIERPATVLGLMGVAYGLAALFLGGVPMAAEPISTMLPQQMRTQISEIAWAQADAFTAYCDDADEAGRILNAMAHRMMTAANVPGRDNIWITIVDSRVPNAFAMPDENIIITASLIEIADHPDEIAAVIAHEIAHIERNHVMRNIVAKMGLGVFFDIVVGGGGAGQAIALASGNLAGLSYSRGFEEEADVRSFDMLDAAGLDPSGSARLFDNLRARLQEEVGEEIPALLSTHPSTAARIAAARARAREGREPALTAVEWRIVRAACGRGAAAPAQGVPETPTPAPDSPAPMEKPGAAPGGGKTRIAGFPRQRARARSAASQAARPPR